MKSNRNGYRFIDKEQRRLLFKKLYDCLEAAIGPTFWWPADTSFEMSIGAILTQNAPWSGAEKSIANLREGGLFDVHAISNAPEQTLADAIRPSIYYNQKAKKLKIFCRYLIDNLSGDIKNLSWLDIPEARNALLSLSGIGPETADSILLYALHMPVFVVDAYTRRIFSRHRLIDTGWDYERLRAFFEEAIEPDALFYGEFHALICLLGAETCKKNPLCNECPVREVLGEPVI